METTSGGEGNREGREGNGQRCGITPLQLPHHPDPRLPGKVSDSHYQSTLDAVYVYVVPWSEFPIVPSKAPSSDGMGANGSGTNSDIGTSRVHFVGASLPDGN